MSRFDEVGEPHHSIGAGTAELPCELCCGDRAQSEQNMFAGAALKTFFSTLHAVMAVLFIAISLMLMVMAAMTGWKAVGIAPSEGAEQAIEAIGLLAIAVVSLQISQTIAEEEVIRDAHISAPTRVRRYLSRFMVVVVVALSIEGLVGTFKALHEDPELLPHAASVLVAAGVLLAGWGLFIRFNKEAELLEPEAMEEAKSEDAKVQE
jgi:hypothetical protein